MSFTTKRYFVWSLHTTMIHPYQQQQIAEQDRLSTKNCYNLHHDTRTNTPVTTPVNKKRRLRKCITNDIVILVFISNCIQYLTSTTIPILLPAESFTSTRLLQTRHDSTTIQFKLNNNNPRYIFNNKFNQNRRQRRNQEVEFSTSLQSKNDETIQETNKILGIDTRHLISATDSLLRNDKRYRENQCNEEDTMNKNIAYESQRIEAETTTITSSRRTMFGNLLIAAGTVVGAGINPTPAEAVVSGDMLSESSKLVWQVTPINKRTGVTVYDAEQTGYSVSFVTYLSRFLLCFDRDCQKWWYNRAGDIRLTASSVEVDEARFKQFAAFSASVEVGLQEYCSPDGPAIFLNALVQRYCPSIEEIQRVRVSLGKNPLNDIEILKKQREINESRRQIVLLFALMNKNQPVKQLKQQLAAIDDARIVRAEVIQRGSGYAPGYGSPEVRFPKPDAIVTSDDETEYQRATGRAILSPNGKILRIDVVNRGIGYSKPPEVTISSPATIRFQDRESLSNFAEAKDTTATAQAFLFRSGPNKGRIERIQLIEPGDGYSANEIIRVKLTPPELSRQEGGETATAAAILEYEVSEIQIIKNGTGYAADAPIDIYVEPPPVTARINMNDPLIVSRVLSGTSGLNEWLPAMDSRLKVQQLSDKNEQSSSLFNKISFAAGKGGQNGCIGRECYDSPVKAVGYPRTENNRGGIFEFQADVTDNASWSNFFSRKRLNDLLQTTIQQQLQQPLGVNSGNGGGGSSSSSSFVSGSSSTGDVPLRLNLGGETSSSSQLLQLLPAGIGLQFDPKKKQYVLAVDPEYSDGKPRWMKYSTTQRIDPDFGPRGREPIMRDMELGVAAYLRFVLSGAICCSGVHLIVTPIDVVKTKVQADPIKYPGIIKSFRRVLDEEGIEGLAQGWLPTFVGFFVWGGLSYALTEYLRRVGTSTLGEAASQYEVLIILAAAGTAAALCSYVLCPFESLRIRLVSQKESNALLVLNTMIQEEGIGTFFKAVPLFCAKDIPFAMAKFTVFDITTKYLYGVFPAAREDIQLSLFVSLFGGILGGMAAAVVSNPADVTITTMKKSKNQIGIGSAIALVMEEGGASSFFRGLPLRIILVAMVVSLQFLVYDSIRFLLGVGSDDLKLYLDVLGGALSEVGGPV